MLLQLDNVIVCKSLTLGVNLINRCQTNPYCSIVVLCLVPVFQSEPVIVRKSLTLGYNLLNMGQVENNNLGSITVSAVFRPVSAVAKSGKLFTLYRSPSVCLFLIDSNLILNYSFVDTETLTSTQNVY